MIPARDEGFVRDSKIPENDRAADLKDAFPKISARDPPEGTCISPNTSRSCACLAQGYRIISYKADGEYQPLCDAYKKSDNTP